MTKKALTLSIVIPVYNDKDHLKACLESIKKQSEMPKEVIVVDNNCTDGSMKVAKQYDFVRIVKEKKQGVLPARTKGFNATKTDIIGRIDADTQLHQDWVAKVKELFKGGAVAAASGPVGFHDTPVWQVGLFFDKNIRRAAWRLGAKDDAVFLFGSNMAIRRDAWLDIQADLCDRNDIHEDIDIAIHLDRKGYLVVFDDSLTALASSRRMSDSAQQMKKYLEVYKNTYAIHGIKSQAITLTSAIVLASRYGIKQLRRAYDSKTKQFSLKKFLSTETESRVHPMDPTADQPD